METVIVVPPGEGQHVDFECVDNDRNDIPFVVGDRVRLVVKSSVLPDAVVYVDQTVTGFAGGVASIPLAGMPSTPGTYKYWLTVAEASGDTYPLVEGNDLVVDGGII